MEQTFSVFGKTGGGGDPELVAHFNEWGWHNFLFSIAETKIFDIPGSGKDSLTCVENANAYRVLLFASEKKDYDLAVKAVYDKQK